MRLLLLPLLALLALPGLARADDAKAKDGFRLIHVADLVRMQKAPFSRVQVFDANHQDFREENGVIPGAKLLSSYRTYDVAKELPADKSTPLVFYCANKL